MGLVQVVLVAKKNFERCDTCPTSSKRIKNQGPPPTTSGCELNFFSANSSWNCAWNYCIARCRIISLPHHVQKTVYDTISIWHKVSKRYLGVDGSSGLWLGNHRGIDALAAQNAVGILCFLFFRRTFFRNHFWLRLFYWSVSRRTRNTKGKSPGPGRLLCLQMFTAGKVYFHRKSLQWIRTFGVQGCINS